jgi:hypothetical protein
MRFKQKLYRFKSVFLSALRIIAAPINNGNILFPGEITGELTETRAHCIFYSWILCIHRYRILSTAILLGLREISNTISDMNLVVLNYYIKGNSIINSLPSFSFVLTFISPPCAFIIS